MIGRTLALAAALTAAACLAPRPLELESTISLDAVPISYGSGQRDAGRSFRVDPEEWSGIRALFEPAPATPRDERAAVADAVARLEQIAGEQHPTCWDLGRNTVNEQHAEGRLDCKDESINTTVYLLLLQQEGLLRHHDVMTRLVRRPYVFRVHYTAQLRERPSGQRYVVDSWFRDNGEPPYVQLAEAWERDEPLPDVIE